MFHPYLVIVRGTDILNFNSVYVYVGKKLFEVTSILSAVELCIQCVKVLHKDFMIVSNHIWNFLESKILSFSDSKGYQAVNELAQAIQLD